MPTENNQNQTPQQTLPVQPVAPVYTEDKTTKILQETGKVVATVGMLTGLIAAIKSLFKK